MERNPTWTCVVAALLIDADGRWLMHRRPPGKAHGGLWEFPGGKVDAGEDPAQALVREIMEEIDLAIPETGLQPLTFAQTTTGADGSQVVIMLYTARNWRGRARSLEGGEVAWLEQSDVAELKMPPLDIELLDRARRLLPE